MEGSIEVVRSIQTLFENIFENHERSSVTGKTTQFIYDRRGLDLEIVIEQCIQNNLSQANISRFVNATQKSVLSLIKKENIEGLLPISKQEIVKIAEDRNIPLSSYDQRAHPYLNSDWFSGLKLDGLDKCEKIRQSLRWANCLTEFYSGALLFNENTRLTSNTFGQLMGEHDETDPLYVAWLEGFLQCDLDK